MVLGLSAAMRVIEQHPSWVSTFLTSIVTNCVAANL
jgi:hypothetical protein